MALFRTRAFVHLLMCGALIALPDPAPAEPSHAPDNAQAAAAIMRPREALAHLRLPEGFKATLFAAEPDVEQPLAMTFDDHGRLWVIECYSYPQWQAPDRVLIFEDTDNDGHFDKRTVFLENGHNLTGIELGFGGVFLCSAPNLIFIPIQVGQDTPTGPPVVLLDGWNSKEAQHNIFNGLSWGPDGWLYGCQGILADSLIGRPGTPPDQRVRMNCGIWRYHPTLKAFEVVASGTTNPWGVDWNDVGEAFFSNCVIGHLWHLIPGAHYERMYGNDFNPYVYGLIGATSDHLHWPGRHWSSARGGEENDSAGGGHAHCGTMIYLGDNWPSPYRDTFFTVNIHGRRLNNDILERRGSGYVGDHGKDFAFWGDPWFRGVTVKYGPDGGVYVLDWSDDGECHDYLEIHRETGRIYKIMYGDPRPLSVPNVAKLTTRELVELQASPKEWYVRHARRRLQEIALEDGHAHEEVKQALLQQLSGSDLRIRLRALWSIEVMQQLNDELLESLLSDRDEVMRAWAVRLLHDPARQPVQSPGDSLDKLDHLVADMAAHDSASKVRLSIASDLQGLSPSARWLPIDRLLQHAEDAEDPNLPLMIWYATEPLVVADPPRAIQTAIRSKLPLVKEFIFRRLASDAKAIETLLTALQDNRGDNLRVTMLQGIDRAMAGRAGVHAPQGWPAVLPALLASGNAEVVREAEALSLGFGDRDILPRMRKQLLDAKTAVSERERALTLLVRARDSELTAMLPKLMHEPPELRGPVLRAMARFNDAKTPEVILSQYRELSLPERQAAVSTLASRLAFASALLDAMERRVVPREDVSAYDVRQMLGFKDDALKARIEKAWGAIRQTSQDKRKALADLKKTLPYQFLTTGDPSAGRAVFARICMACHTMFGVGGKIGPDLTGSNRANLDYILENVVDPSAIVGREYQLNIFEMEDGQVLTGIIRNETDSGVTVQTQTEEVVLPKSRITERRSSPLSMMPEDLFAGLKREEIRDLVRYLASPRQAPLPSEKK